MEFSLTKETTVSRGELVSTQKKVLQFETIDELIQHIRTVGEIDGWVLRVHHM